MTYFAPGDAVAYEIPHHGTRRLSIVPLVMAALFGGAFAVARAQTDLGTVVSTRDLALLRDVGGTQAGLSISPTGRWVAYNLRRGDPDRNQYTNQWVLLDLTARAARVVVKDAGPPLLSYGDDLYPWDDFNQGIQAFAPVWSPDEATMLYVRRDRVGIRLHRLNVRTGRSTPVPLPSGKVVGLHDDAGAAVVTIEVQTATGLDTTRRRRAEGVLFTGNEFSPVRGIPTFRTPTERRTLRLDPRTGDTLAPRQAPRDACEAFPGWPRDQDLTKMYRDCVFDPAGKPVAIGVDLTTPHQAFAVYTMAGDRPQRISPVHDWIYAPLTWHSGRFYYVGRNGYAKSDLYEVAANGETRALTKSPYFISNCAFHFGPSPFAVCTAETLDTPRELARIDLRTGGIDVLTSLNPEYNARRRPRSKEFTWSSASGHVVTGTITHPLAYDSTRRYPVVVTSYPHPGFTRGSNGDEFPIPVLAARGFLVLDVAAPAYHYWTALDISFDTFVRAYEAPLRGLEQYLRKLADDGVADLERVGIGGLSGGANFAAYAVSHSTLFRAAIFGWHETDYLATITLGTDRTRDLHSRRGLGIADTANWRAYSLGSRADHVSAAVLLNAAASEFFFAFGSYDALKRNGNAVEMWVYPEAHHVKWLPAQRLTTYDRNVEWFNYWLRDVRDPSPGKAAQYKRWDELRSRHARRLRSLGPGK